MEIELTPDTEDIVRSRLATGLYLDASDVIRDALRHLFETHPAPARGAIEPADCDDPVETGD